MANQYGQIVGDFASKNKLSGSVVPLGQIGGNIDRAAVAYEKNYRILDNPCLARSMFTPTAARIRKAIRFLRLK